MEINVRLYHTLGCSVVANSMLVAIARNFPGACVRVYSPSPEIQAHSEGISEVYPLEAATGYRLHVDLAGYLDEYKPLVTKPYRHLKEYMFDIADSNLGVKLDRSIEPVIAISPTELDWARSEVNKLSDGKSVVWVQTKTSRSSKDWAETNWNDLKNVFGRTHTFLDLTNKQYSPRQACLLTKVCTAGVVLDTFLLHGSHAVGARNTIAILVCSPQEAVCYPDQIALDGTRDPSAISPENVIATLSGVLNCGS